MEMTRDELARELRCALDALSTAACEASDLADELAVDPRVFDALRAQITFCAGATDVALEEPSP